MIKNKFILSIALLNFSFSFSYSQNLAIGQWRAHLPFNKAKFVTEGNNSIICGAEDGIFIYHKADNSLETITKINGLSDINLSMLRYYPAKDILFVGYEDGNIDLMQGKTIYNISDIKRKNILGSKRINNLMFFDKYAYLACNFGLVVIDLDKKEIKDTYYLNLSGNNNSVYGVANDGTNLYALSDSGVFQNSLSNPNIAFFGSWNNLNAPAGSFIHLIWFSNRLFIKTIHDNLWKYESGSWQPTNTGLYDTHSIQIAHDKMLLAGYDVIELEVVNNNLMEKLRIHNSSDLYAMRDAITDQDDVVWIADNNKGLVKALSASFEYITPDGPKSSKAGAMQSVNGQLWVGHGTPHGNRWDALYSTDGFSTFVNNKWTTYDHTNTFSEKVNLDTVLDFMSLAVDPLKSTHVFLGSRGKGVVEFEDGAIKNYFNGYNSAIQNIPGYPGTFWMGGMVFDSENNLWMINSNVPSPLIEYKTDGTSQSFSLPGFSTNGVLLGDLMYSSYGELWINVLGQGIIIAPATDLASYKNLTGDPSKTGLPSGDVRALAEDKQGQVWIGTGKGVAVIYSPGSTPQQILLLQDGSYQYLLATEIVTAIAIDGANRKWFGTAGSGVFLMNEDGTQQISHFTAEDSPLLSNAIYSIAIDQKSGEVFFGTDRGIISYKGDATEGGDKCANTYVYPNPVRHEYEGPIAITGLVNNGNIKITDISGTLVYETTALGGQAIWYGKNFKGDKAHTGVYLVFCSDADGKNTCITKLLLIN